MVISRLDIEGDGGDPRMEINSLKLTRSFAQVLQEGAEKLSFTLKNALLFSLILILDTRLPQNHFLMKMAPEVC